MTIPEIRKILRDVYGARQYRITWDGAIHVYGRMPNSIVTGWWLFGALNSHLTEQHLRYLSGEDAA
jgi:hypothetical protein